MQRVTHEHRYSEAHKNDNFKNLNPDLKSESVESPYSKFRAGYVPEWDRDNSLSVKRRYVHISTGCSHK